MKRLRINVCKFLYYYFARWLPSTETKWGGVFSVGKFAKKIRLALVRNIFEYCGEHVNIQKGAHFGSGERLRIGDNSGLGINCVIPEGTIIGNDVMMGPNVFIHSRNHRFDRTDIPMRLQGNSESKPCIIDDDVWIGRDVTIMVGRHISKGTIVASNSVVTKDFPPYSIIGGNPAKLIRNRLQDNQNN